MINDGFWLELLDVFKQFLFFFIFLFFSKKMRKKWFCL